MKAFCRNVYGEGTEPREGPLFWGGLPGGSYTRLWLVELRLALGWETGTCGQASGWLHSCTEGPKHQC